MTVQAFEERIADLLVDASLTDILALSFHFNTKELADSGLWPRVQAARQPANELIDCAGKLLEPLEITRDTLIRFLFEQIERRAGQE